MASDPLAALPERRLTAELARYFAEDDAGVQVGIGDDGAVVRTSPRTVLACDPVVEGVHFDRQDRLDLVGRKAVNRNLSDLAAMGARPTYLLLSILVPDWMTAADRDAVFGGVRRAARKGACTVVGGDVSRTPGGLVLTVTAVGEAPRRPLLRSGLAAGDTLHITGPLGGSRLGRHLRFPPRIAHGQWLAGQRVVSAAMDVSDGLLLDLATMLAASAAATGADLGAVIESAAVPVAAAAERAASASGRSSLEHALTDGEDHELLFGLRGALLAGGPITARARRPIGLVTATPGLYLRGADGGMSPVPPHGYHHDLSAWSEDGSEDWSEDDV
jgi:thiamine-monophosphate kinase